MARCLSVDSFSSVGGQPRNGLVRLNADGTLDVPFNPNLTSLNDAVDAIAIQPDGKILVSGSFSFIGGQSRYHFARLDPMTGAADSFSSDAAGQIIGIQVQPDGKILLNGAFGYVGGQVRNRIARLDPVTGQADSFDPNPGQGTSQAALCEYSCLAAGRENTCGWRLQCVCTKWRAIR